MTNLSAYSNANFAASYGLEPATKFFGPPISGTLITKFPDDTYGPLVAYDGEWPPPEQEQVPQPPSAPNPAPPEGIADTNEAIAVCLSPDVCKTPIGSSTPAIPYQVYGKAGDDGNYSQDVFFSGHRAMRFDSTLTKTYGDEPGTATGVKSGTVGDIVEPTSHSPHISINGKQAIRHRDNCTLNNGNCPGEFIFVQDTSTYDAPDANNLTEQQVTQDNRSSGRRLWDGFGNNASETWQGIKTLGSAIAEETIEGATNLVTSPIKTIGDHITGRAETALSIATWSQDVAQNLWQDPAGTLERGKENALVTGGAIWHAIADPYSDAYASGGLAQAVGHGSFDAVKLGVEALLTKGAVTVAGKTASGAGLIVKASRKTDAVEHVAKSNDNLPGKIKKNSDLESRKNDGGDGVRVTPRVHNVQCFDMPPGLDAKEYDRQLKEQMQTINRMTADDMEYAHWVLERAGGTKALRQPGAQKRHRENYEKYLSRQGWTNQEIQGHMAGLHATHFLDMIAGGDPVSFSIDKNGNPILGNGAVNSDIGNRWKLNNRAQSLREEAGRMRKSGRSGETMNVSLRRCKKGI